MEQLGKSLVLRPLQAALTLGESDSPMLLPMFFNHNEEFFISLPKSLKVPSLPIHHDVRSKSPGSGLADSLQLVRTQLYTMAPSYFHASTPGFDPTEHLKLPFFSLYRIEDQTYLYLCKVDLTPRRASITLVSEGTNDLTPAYETTKLFVEAELIPLENLQRQEGTLQCTPKQSVSETWIGESGRGYFVQGIWIDRELSKFFSKIFTPEGTKLYPYFPLTCRYRAICANLLTLDPVRRKEILTYLHRARLFLEPRMEYIESALRKDNFSETMHEYLTLKHSIGTTALAKWLQTLVVKPYLNNEDMKEFEVKFEHT